MLSIVLGVVFPLVQGPVSFIVLDDTLLVSHLTTSFFVIGFVLYIGHIIVELGIMIFLNPVVELHVQRFCIRCFATGGATILGASIASLLNPWDIPPLGGASSKIQEYVAGCS
jgi:hypothetical protein